MTMIQSINLKGLYFIVDCTALKFGVFEKHNVFLVAPNLISDCLVPGHAVSMDTSLHIVLFMPVSAMKESISVCAMKNRELPCQTEEPESHSRSTPPQSPGWAAVEINRTDLICKKKLSA